MINKYTHSKTIHNNSAAGEVLPYIFELFNPSKILDIGTGTGSWLEVAKELGVKKVLGVDGIQVQKDMLVISDDEFIKHDLSTPLTISEKFDLAICMEVAEHLDANAADILVDTLTRHSDIILFSAAIPGQGGQFHINEQWPDYWQKKFATKGYLAFDILRERFWENPKIEWWYKQNMLIYANPERLRSLNFESTNKVRSKIHPEHFAIKMDEIDRLNKVIKDKILHPKLGFTLKLLLKSILNVFK